MLRSTLQKISGLFQSATGSYRRHNAQYEEAGKLERERRAGQAHLQNDLINGPEIRARDLLARHPKVRTAVDIGSGTGWSAAALSPLLERVIAIEPSAAAVGMARELYPADRYPNIAWINGFAEEAIPALSLPAPALFLTGCVLSHIRDKEVEKICAAVDAIAPPGSILSFVECWGDHPWHQLMWHVRTREWWQARLPGWELDFHGPPVPEPDAYKGAYHKGFWGVKVR